MADQDDANAWDEFFDEARDWAKEHPGEALTALFDGWKTSKGKAAKDPGKNDDSGKNDGGSSGSGNGNDSTPPKRRGFFG